MQVWIFSPLPHAMLRKLALNLLSKVGVSDVNSSICAKLSEIAAECVSEHGKSQCADISGECVTERDGYYWVSALCLTFGVAFLLAYSIPTARKLQGKFSIIPFILLMAKVALQPYRCPPGALMSDESLLYIDSRSGFNFLCIAQLQGNT